MPGMIKQNAAFCSTPIHPGIVVSAKHRLTVNLEDREYKELSALARKNRVSLAWLGRQAIIEFLDRYASEERQLPLNLPERGDTAKR